MRFNYMYYILHNGKKIYFEYNLEGFKQIQAYVQNNNISKRTIYVEKRNPKHE